jgi:NAD(P)-dependent dehydrogenase (short-subunit alcohol dehydrogenase family)
MAKTVLITGASSGIGKASAQLFAQRGWNVVATSRTPSKFGLWSAAERIVTIELDVNEERSIARAVTAAEARYGGIDVLVNNAGVGLAGPLEGVSIEQLRRIFEANFFGVAAMCKAVIPHMRQRKSGTIVNVTSIMGRVGLPFLSPYNASKFAVEGLSESLSSELALIGVRMKIVEPGGVKTAFAHEWHRHDAYEPKLGGLIDKMTAGLKTAKGPDGVAHVIFKAATGRSKRLRYTANGSGPLLMLNQILPRVLWRAIIRSAFLGRR